MDVENEPVSLEKSPEIPTDETPVKQDHIPSEEILTRSKKRPENPTDETPANQDNRPSTEGHNSSRKRPFRDISTGSTKAVIICNSSELTKSEANTYRPNNIVIELLKKNPMRYGKFTFQKFTSEKEIREELSSRFTILKNKK